MLSAEAQVQGRTPDEVELAAAATAAPRLCPACGADAPEPLPHYSRDPWHIVQCTSCGFVYLKNPPDYAALISDLAWEKQAKSEKTRRKEAYPVLHWLDTKTRWRLKILTPPEKEMLKTLFAPGPVLDVGCSKGTRLPTDAFTPYGVEISEALHRMADKHMRAHGGYCIHAAAIEGTRQFPEGHFTGVLLRSFLEHEVDPKGLLEAGFRVLKPGGSVYIRVPNYSGCNRRLIGHRWPGFRLPDHVNYFTDRSLKAMAEACGFTFRLKNRANFYVDDNIHALLIKPE